MFWLGKEIGDKCKYCGNELEDRYQPQYKGTFDTIIREEMQRQIGEEYIKPNLYEKVVNEHMQQEINVSHNNVGDSDDDSESAYMTWLKFVKNERMMERNDYD